VFWFGLFGGLVSCFWGWAGFWFCAFTVVCLGALPPVGFFFLFSFFFGGGEAFFLLGFFVFWCRGCSFYVFFGSLCVCVCFYLVGGFVVVVLGCFFWFWRGLFGFWFFGGLCCFFFFCVGVSFLLFFMFFSISVEGFPTFLRRFAPSV